MFVSCFRSEGAIFILSGFNCWRTSSMFKRSSLQVFGQGLFTERLAERMVSLLPDYALEGPCELPPQLDMPIDIALAVTRLDEVRSVDVLLCQSREVIY